MPTNDTDPRMVRRHGRRHELARLASWPLTLALLVAWREHALPETSGAPAQGRAPVKLEARSFGDLRLAVPAGWVTLDRRDGHVTWGEPDRSHTVTLAATEASVLPLPGVVAAVVRESESALPGARADGRAVPVDVPGGAPRGDAAVVARFVVDDDGGQRLHVAQAWRRDARAGIDVVATWTSADGRWPVPPRSGIPRPVASG